MAVCPGSLLSPPRLRRPPPPVGGTMWWGEGRERSLPSLPSFCQSLSYSTPPDSDNSRSNRAAPAVEPERYHLPLSPSPPETQSRVAITHPSLSLHTVRSVSPPHLSPTRPRHPPPPPRPRPVTVSGTTGTCKSEAPSFVVTSRPGGPIEDGAVL